jgi:hypothetical protein
MRIRELFKTRKAPQPQPLRTDWTSEWTTGWTTRDWADLPVHHPRREDDAIR